MQPRIFIRWASTAAKPRKGRKGHLYLVEHPPPPPTPEEEIRITFRRHQKAERDERMDITMALTPPKIYMGGFTRPRDLRASHWFPGGPYVLKGKIYETPPESAYEPHTVFLLESRYRVRHGIGRVDAKDHITAVCRAADFVKLMAKYNSSQCSGDARESMDNANWPFTNRGKVLKPTKWWGNENLEDIMQEVYGDEVDKAELRTALLESEEEVDEDKDLSEDSKQQRRPSEASAEPSSRAVPSARPPAPMSNSNTTPKLEALRMPAKGSMRERSHPPQPEVLSHITAKVHMGERSLPPHLTEIDIQQLRRTYLEHNRTEPFWRPLLAVTVSTRPLALSISRLAKSMGRGLPFYASMSSDERKCLYSFSHRMTNLRTDRFHELTREVIMRLAGYKGGFVGIRFGTNQRGRGINGEGLADPIPWEKRVVKVQVGRWYERAEEVAETFREDGLAWGGHGAVDVALMNDWGRRLDEQGNEVPLTEEEKSQEDVLATEEDSEDAEDAEGDADGMEAYEDELKKPWKDDLKRKLKPALRGEDETADRLRRKLALRNAQYHRSVVRL